jgi:hypothetical protein
VAGEEEVERAFKLLKIRGLKREMKELSLEIKDAELLGDKEKLESAREDFQKASQRLSNLSA